MGRKRKSSTSDKKNSITLPKNDDKKGSILTNKNRKKSNDDDDNDNDGSIDNNLGTVIKTSCYSKENEKNINNKNPLLIKQRNFLKKLSYKERYHFFSNTHITTEQRATIWNEQCDIGETLINLYSWATPDSRCIHILQKFQPIIEIGCGTNAYWYQQMIYNNINCIAYDIQPTIGGQIIHHSNNNNNTTTKKQKRKKSNTINVKKGGPEVLKDPKYNNHTLFLCYPDEEQMEVDDDDDDTTESNSHDSNDSNNNNKSKPKTKRITSMANECIKNYTGEYIIHVGELFMIGNIPLCIDQNNNNNDDNHDDNDNEDLILNKIPWGRSSHYLFQIQLVSQFHCILKLQLNNWLHTTDTITVWKRTKTTSIIYRDTDDNDNNDSDTNNDTNGNNSKDEEVQFRYIPPNEQLPIDSIAPCLQEWYNTTVIGNNNNKQQQEQTKTIDDDNDSNVNNDDSTAKIQHNNKSTQQRIPKIQCNNTNKNKEEDEEEQEQEQQQEQQHTQSKQEDNNNNNNNNKKSSSKKSSKKRKSHNTQQSVSTNNNEQYSCPW